MLLLVSQNMAIDELWVSQVLNSQNMAIDELWVLNSKPPEHGYG